ncbi:MAG: hypothetical protein IM333_09830 [Microcystis sp. M048S1]|jgi:hypothetical protein|uniref:Uncharacterized protein n=1 Tax=Microcystis aeruginosa PCC 9701 TaxID=721123 RepID=I4IXX6_MICAE|nr:MULTISPECIES: hypothetical protein [Microcystis]MCA2902208.1 hypothetical protein [Microcystis sp. M035S1]MCA2720827.1 hypothetical protein [Microcystis sp. M176S2]MCA2727961.1 hypothetical protein [Microcystis sp. M166S2]MCA2728715.1 hypothetical protein [Microcystis sp. M162S2]MCA2747948.1 hypothetical protein [Microcystis sp. M155S2]
MSFPYTQCISAITIPAGEYKNYTFVVAAYQSGISVGQFSPNPTPPSYTLGGVSNLDNNGASTTAIEFLLDYSNTDYSPPYYFVYGSEDENIWLNSINPATGGSHFTSSNVTTQIASEKQPDAPIARLFYYFPESLLYVAASNGNLYWYSVTWSSDGKPSLSYVGSNTSYNGDGDYEPSGAPISLTFFPANTLTNYDCLLLGGVKEATWVMFNAQNPSSTPHLFSCPTGAFEGTAIATGICKGPEGIYWSTGYSLNYMDYGNYGSLNSVIWTVPSDQAILSLAYSPNAGNADPGYYPKGAIFIATAPPVPSNSSMGSIWVVDVSSNTVGNAAQQDATISGSPWAIIADANLNYMCATGSCGVFLSTLAAYNPESNIPENGMLVPNQVTSGVGHTWISDLVSAAALVFGVVTEDPVAVGWAVAGIDAEAIDSQTGY